MGHHDNDKVRDERAEQDERRQELRDEVFDKTGGEVDNLGSQDKRRKAGERPL